MANIELVPHIHFRDFMTFPIQITDIMVLHDYESSGDGDGTGVHSGSFYNGLHHQTISR